jgi:uncharacterized protein (TIGR03435 family)
MLRSMAALGFAGAFFFALAIAPCQAPPKLEFEVASVKPSAPAAAPGETARRELSGVSVIGGPGTRFPDRFTFNGATLRALLFRAYGLVDMQQQISGPAWIGTERYAVVAKLPPGTTQEQFQEMLQNLLAERFALMVHHETKVLPVYDLVIGKNGHKLKESPKGADGAAAGQLSGKQDQDGFPVVPKGYAGTAMHGEQAASGQVAQNWVFGQQTIESLAGLLSSLAGRRVLDKTSLLGKYDFTLHYELQPSGLTQAGVTDLPALNIFEAVQQQLGLKLVDAKEPFDIVVVDHAERIPIDN